MGGRIAASCGGLVGAEIRKKIVITGDTTMKDSITLKKAELKRRDARIAQIADDLKTGRLVKVDHPDGSASLYDGPNAPKPN